MKRQEFHIRAVRLTDASEVCAIHVTSSRVHISEDSTGADAMTVAEREARLERSFTPAGLRFAVL
jgi:hypothetical protein